MTFTTLAIVEMGEDKGLGSIVLLSYGTLVIRVWLIHVTLDGYPYQLQQEAGGESRAPLQNLPNHPLAGNIYQRAYLNIECVP